MDAKLNFSRGYCGEQADAIWQSNGMKSFSIRDVNMAVTEIVGYYFTPRVIGKGPYGSSTYLAPHYQGSVVVIEPQKPEED
ncbi:hypothetical protein ES705_50900 [subsurface metagenome]